MRISSRSTIRQFGEKHPDPIDAPNNWYFKTKQAEWLHLQDIKKTFNSVDFVKNDRYVFNVKGNKYRLVAMIFLSEVLYISVLSEHMPNTTKLMFQKSNLSNMTIQKINNDIQYKNVLASIEDFLQKATGLGGFEHLPAHEKDELERLSLMANDWEDAQLIMPIPSQALGESNEDLNVIEGIGPKIQDIFRTNGIKNLDELAKSTVDFLDSILKKAGPRYRMHNPESWPDQAKEILKHGHRKKYQITQN